MMTTLEFIISFLGGSALLLFAVAWLIRTLVSQFLAKDLENYKTKLQFESQIELTKFKSEIEKSAFEHQIIFSKLHDKHAEIIAELYSKIVNLHKATNLFVKMLLAVTEEQRKENLEKLWTAVDDFREYFDKNKIFFKDKTCQKVEQLNDSMSEPVSKLVMHLEMSAQNNDVEPVFNAWEKAEQQIEEIVSVIKKDLEDEFREILGVHKIDSA